MIASCPKSLPLRAPEIDAQVIDLPIEQSPQILISEKEYLELKCEVGYWRAMHNKSIAREKILKQKIKEQEGQIRDLRNRVFGKKSEKKGSSKNESKSKNSTPKRPRGQQPGSKGHGRTQRPELPEKTEYAELTVEPVCPCCNKPYIPDENKETEIIEVEVSAYTRRIIRQSMTKGCTCKGVPKTITAPMPAKVLPKSPYGISIWEAVLLTKFNYCQPTNRLIHQYAELGLPISGGSIAGGLKCLKKLFEPVYEALYQRQMTEDRFHNDESGWKVFESVEHRFSRKL